MEAHCPPLLAAQQQLPSEVREASECTEAERVRKREAQKLEWVE